MAFIFSKIYNLYNKTPGHLYDLKTPSLHSKNSEWATKNVNLKMSRGLTIFSNFENTPYFDELKPIIWIVQICTLANQKALYGLGLVTGIFVGVVFVIPFCQETYRAWTDPVLTLTNSNFAKYVKNTPEIMVEFYAPWCGHCKALAPEYEAAAIELQSREGGKRLAKVKCIEISQFFNIKNIGWLHC